MKVVFITETFLPSTDGIVTRLLKAIDYMQKKGYEVIIYAPDIKGTPSNYMGAQVKTFRAQFFSFYKERPWAVPTLRIGYELKKDQPDVVHAFNQFSLAASGAFFAHKMKLPLVSSFHTNIPQYLSLYGYGWLRKLSWTYIRHWHNLSLINMTPSQAMADLLEEQNVKDAIVLPKGVDLKERHPKFKNEATKSALMNGQSGKKLLLFVGRLAQEKELSTLKPLLETHDDLHLAIVGDGPDRERLEAHFEGLPVTFTGFLHGEELSQVFASADAFIFPSISETLGQVILEAMASGIPVLAAKSGPTVEQITHGENGLIYNQSDMNTLTSLLNQLDKKAYRERIVENGLKYASNYSWDNTNQTMLNAYKKAIAMKNVELEDQTLLKRI